MIVDTALLAWCFHQGPSKELFLRILAIFARALRWMLAEFSGPQEKEKMNRLSVHSSKSSPHDFFQRNNRMGDSMEFPVRDGHPSPIPVLPRRSLSSNTRTRAFLSMEGSRLTKRRRVLPELLSCLWPSTRGGYTLRLSVPRASSPKILKTDQLAGSIKPMLPSLRL